MKNKLIQLHNILTHYLPLLRRGLGVGFLLLSTITHAQSWQWGKTGGSSDIMNNDFEGVYSMVTDSQKNVYMLSRIGNTNLQIDGHPKQGFDEPNNYPKDVLFASFACDGSYRWSKVIGGRGTEVINNLQIDAQDNIYFSGVFATCEAPLPWDPTQYYPPRIENDFVIPQTYITTDCRLTFLAKYNSSGILQWIKRPEPTRTIISDGNGLFSFGLSVDSQGNSFWLVCAPQGLYDGIFTNSLTNSNFSENRSWFVFKYDTNGNFVSGTPLDLQFYNPTQIKFFRNPNNGNYYITAQKNISATATAGGQTVVNNLFLACFNNQGVFQWKKENNTNLNYSPTYIHNIVFDAQNNIYLSLTMAGFDYDIFLGYTISESLVPSSVIKVDTNANNLLWSTHDTSRVTARSNGATILNGNEIVYTNIGTNGQIWGNQVGTTYAGAEIMLARFNKDTGACLGLSYLPNNHTGPDNNTAMSLAADASGDILLGGSVENALYLGNGTPILNNGTVETDFFIAKYATTACSPLATESFESQDKRLLIAPNPATETVSVNYEFQEVFSSKTVEVIDMLGRVLLNLRINDMKGSANIDCSKYSAGQFVIVLKENGVVVGNSKLLVR
jgi:hypothetical protein